ncbi:MAG TPA: EAL domain-containing protein, partial [Burkholderiaceae bacterium]|nr:EAL domain-containing protein [Burkholderiaceae bacterium]
RLFRQRSLTFQVLSLVVVCAGSVAALLFLTAGLTGEFDPDPNSVGLVAGSMGLLVIALAFVIPLVLRPLSRLTDVVTEVASRRDFAMRADESHAREVHQLAAAFNQLLNQIEQRDQSLARELSEKSEAQQRLAQLAHFDPVTGLHNRHYFNLSVDRSLSGQLSNVQLAVMFVDLDDFKQVNDSLGHAAGDALLREVARRLVAALRKTDVVCRLGGDEFAVILPLADGSTEASAVAAKLLAGLAMPLRIADHEMFISASIGVALASTGEMDAGELLRRADVAMYEAKASGKGIYRIFEDQMTVRASRRAGMTQRLRAAIEADSLRLAYQPQVDLRNGRVLRVEALLRWHDEELGSVSPIEFIRLAEETGSIHSLGQWVLDRACRDARALAERLGRTLPVAVNVSMRQLCDPGFADLVEDTLARHQLSGSTLELEVTEGTLLAEWADVEDTLARLNQKGVLVAVDDFGNGFSSLRSLRRLPVQRLKIDSGFIANVPADPADTAIVSAILGLARQLKLGVVAEGVETTAQLELLRDLGCEAGQGYLFHRPMTLDALVSHLLETVDQVGATA